MNKTKQIIIWTVSVLLSAFTVLNILQFGFKFIILYLLYLLPAILSVLYTKNQKDGKGFKIGVVITSILSVIIGLWAGGMLNVINLIAYIFLIVAVL
jgi:low temperature requirement protein LtrA